MGTSKGYIAPTRQEWSRAKLAVTSMINDTSSNSISKAVSSFSTAMKSEGMISNSFTKAATGILGLSKSINSHGIVHALTTYGFENLIGKSNEEIYLGILNYYTNSGSSIEDSIAIDSLSLALKNLNILDLDSLGAISSEILLKEMLITYIELHFEQKFTEKIGKGKSPAQADRIITEVKGYIRATLYETLDLQNILEINFENLANEQYVIRTCRDAFTVFENFYEEL